MGDTIARDHDDPAALRPTLHGYPVGTRVRVRVGLSEGCVGEVCDVYADAHRPPVSPYRWYTVRFTDGLRPLYRHDEITPVPALHAAAGSP